MYEKTLYVELAERGP